MKFDEMIAVIQAAKDGEVIEYKQIGCSQWGVATNPAFDFSLFDYRVGHSPIANGWNPQWFTEDQIDVKNGWRCIEKNELDNLPHDAEYYFKAIGWSPSGFQSKAVQYRSRESVTYRTRQPKKQKVKRLLTVDEFGAFFQIKTVWGWATPVRTNRETNCIYFIEPGGKEVWLDLNSLNPVLASHCWQWRGLDGVVKSFVVEEEV